MTFLVLFNGLWQGALLTAAAYAISRMLPAQDAVTRFALWLTTLIAIAVIPVATTLVHAPFAFHPFVGGSGAAGHVSIRLLALSAQARQNGLNLGAIEFWVIVIWAIGVAFNLCRLGRSFAHMASISRNAQASTEPRVFLSDDIEVPLVAGIVAPRILIPSDLRRTLNAIDLQRVVAHERAHIQRNDPWFNLAIRIIEAALFFNPSVYFVGRKLAAEREASCDDVAIAQSGQSFDYATCLAAIAQMRLCRIEVAGPTALGFRTSLLSRIERLQSAQPRIITLNRQAFVGIIMLFAIIAIALQSVTPALALSGPSGQAAQRPVTSAVALSCAQPNIEANVLTPEPPAMPAGLKQSVSAEAVVTIAPTGRVAGVRILRSSGNGAIDAAVLSAARRSTYRPKMLDCVAVEGSYVFRADFKP